MSRIRAVLFDIDGTLLESNDAHAHAWIEAMRGHGHDVPFARVRSKIGMPDDKLLADLLDLDHGSTLGKAITKSRASIMKASYLADLGPFHGARVLVDMLRSRGLVSVAVSSANADEVSELLRTAGVVDLIDDVVCEPGPELVQTTLDRLDIFADEAIMIGDTPYDVEAAARAHVMTIAFRCGGYWSDSDFKDAVAIFDDPADLAAHLDHSPLALDRASLPPPSPVRLRARPAVTSSR